MLAKNRENSESKSHMDYVYDKYAAWVKIMMYGKKLLNQLLREAFRPEMFYAFILYFRVSVCV